MDLGYFKMLKADESAAQRPEQFQMYTAVWGLPAPKLGFVLHLTVWVPVGW